MPMRGSSFSTVVTSCTRPAILMPSTLIPTSSQISASAVPVASMGCRSRTGKNTDRYPTSAMAMAALPATMEIQYPQPMRKPVRLPKAARLYTYGPPEPAT